MSTCVPGGRLKTRILNYLTITSLTDLIVEVVTCTDEAAGDES